MTDAAGIEEAVQRGIGDASPTSDLAKKQSGTAVPCLPSRCTKKTEAEGVPSASVSQYSLQQQCAKMHIAVVGQKNASGCKNLSYKWDCVRATRRLPEIIVSRSLSSCPLGQVFELLQ